MKTRVAFLIVGIYLAAIGSYGEGRTSYANLIKVGALRKQHTIGGESCIRVYLKPLKPEIKVTDIKVHIVRDDTTLKEIPIHVRKTDDPSDEKSFPWEMFLPVDKKYTENDSELVHNLEPGSLKFSIGYGISRDGKIYND